MEYLFCKGDVDGSVRAEEESRQRIGIGCKGGNSVIRLGNFAYEGGRTRQNRKHRIGKISFSVPKVHTTAGQTFATPWKGGMIANREGGKKQSVCTPSEETSIFDVGSWWWIIQLLGGGGEWDKRRRLY